MCIVSDGQFQVNSYKNVLRKVVARIEKVDRLILINVKMHKYIQMRYDCGWDNSPPEAEVNNCRS